MNPTAAEETLNTEHLARKHGKNWATDGSMPRAFIADSDLHVPSYYAEAMRHPDLWDRPMQEELENLRSCGVFHVVKKSFLPAGKKVIGCCWVFANKYDADEAVIKQKVRLVAKGFSQIQEEDFDKTYAAVAQLESFCIAMAIAAQKGLKIWQVDFISAYLNSDCQYDVYMELPPGFALQEEDDEDGIAPQVERSEEEQGDDEEHILVEGGEPGDNEECVLLLLKTVYGMMQGAYDWFYLLDNTFAALRYYQSKADSCVQSRLINGEHTLMSTHTDDVFGAPTTGDGATEAKAELDRCFEIKDLGTLSIILGIKISQDSVTGSISLTQKAYLKRTLEHFGMANCNPKSTPLPPGIDISDDLCPKTKEDR